ncbi:MAG TPA: hypothetical protein PKC28_16100 [Bdellovibrionales bacterium]|nr:hypothetical protein [Bdellovibrionales bacterium]
MIWLALLFSIAFGAPPVATVLPGDFAVGRQWIWDYYDITEQLYSTERYTVVGYEGARAVIEMATLFPGKAEFLAHHRLVVDVNECLEAYASPMRRKPWMLRMRYWNGRKWNAVAPKGTIAFEEKFNCDSYARGYTRSQYSLETGVAVMKEFSHRGVVDYRFRLRSP